MNNPSKAIIVGWMLCASMLASAEVVNIDLKRPLAPQQISIARDVSIASRPDQWVSRAGDLEWTKELQVPGASSVSFAAEAYLPEGVRLIAGSKLVSREYDRNSVSDGNIYGIPATGDTLVIRLVAPAEKLSQVRFRLTKLYAAPTYTESKAVGDTSLRNLYCAIDNINPKAARSTVQVLVSKSVGQSSCTGTLVANARGNFAHNIITAAHCGEDVAYDASKVTVLWNRETNCAEGNVNANSIPGPSSTGYINITTVTSVKDPGNAALQDGDTWLFGSVTAPPNGANPYWSGLNVAGHAADYTAPFEGLGPVFAISHPLALTKTLARSTNPVKNGDFCVGDYECVSSYVVTWNDGRTDNGSSGGALFDQDGLMIGNLAACTSNNLTCFYPKLSTAWTGDGTEGAGLRPYLDSMGTNPSRINGYNNPSRTDNLTLMFASDVKTASNTSVKFTMFIDDAASCTSSATPAVSGFPEGALSFTNGAKRDLTVTVGANRTTFFISCLNSAGTAKEAAIVVNAGAGPGVSAPTVSLTAGAATTTVGSSVTLTWSSVSASSCTASGAWSGSRSTNGSQSVTINAAGVNSFSLSCGNAGGTTTKTTSVTGVSPGLPTISNFSSSADSGTVGSTVMLSWGSSGATSCTASGAWSGPKDVSGNGSVSIGSLGDNTYVLTCSNGAGPVSRSLTVVGTSSGPAPSAPTVSLTASAPSATVGGSVVLQWASEGASACVASESWSGNKAFNGSESVTISSVGDNSYSLTCANDTGSTLKTVHVVGASPGYPVIKYFRASSERLAAGSSVTLVWETDEATTCSASGQWSGALGVDGTAVLAVGPGSNMYVLTCSNGFGSVSATRYIEGTEAGGGGLSLGPKRGGGSTAWQGLVLLLGLVLLRRLTVA